MAPTVTPQIQSSLSQIPGNSGQQSGRTLAILGCGAMGTAILSGIISFQDSSSGTQEIDLLPTRFIACVRRLESADAIRSKLPCEALDSTVSVYVNNNCAAVREADVILLACQPHLYKPLLQESGICAALKGKPVISVLAGVASSEIKRHLVQIFDKESTDIHDLDAVFDAFSVIRAMPNIASAVQASSTVLEIDSQPLTGDIIATARAIFSCVGTVFTTTPEQFGICTTLNGSTPAFFAMVIDGLVDGAVALGLSHTEATQMAATTMRGTADLIMSGKSTLDLRYEVACPGGATIQGLQVLEEARTRAVWMRAMAAATSEQSSLGEGLKVSRRGA
ncbi:unnamed protein product [Clonostachys rosea]|uniref:Pyrroline-5-carboxylate reductase n=1 Tax=Bionectria ochroleuca TaxID=29856 RepID=A0ABY6TXV2_BIOOC|nr:unnamed protein product [Clonostachys rosea]